MSDKMSLTTASLSGWGGGGQGGCKDREKEKHINNYIDHFRFW